MRRFIPLAIAMLATLVAAQTHAQDWAAKMFDGTKYDFGTVARDAKTEHHFVLKNIYADDIHVSGVRTSCGCTTPLLSKTTIKSGETANLTAHFNTDRFQGQRGATITLTIDKPKPAQVQLRVDGFILSDVSLEPGTADFGSLDQGTDAEKQIVIKSTGRRDLGILSARSGSEYIEAEVVPQTTRSGKNYLVKIRLKNPPAGYVADTIALVTADGKTALTVPVEGRVVASITASPTNLFIGEVRMGQKVSKQLVVNGKKPFRILSVHCENPCFAFHTSSDAKTVHVIDVDFQAQAPGKVNQKICIETDMGDHIVAELSAFADVVELAGTP